MILPFITLWLLGAFGIWMLEHSNYQGPNGMPFTNERLEKWHQGLSYEGMVRFDNCLAIFLSLIWPLIVIVALFVFILQKVTERSA